MPNQTDTYTTEAIACGLSDVAGWLENEGGREKHVRTIRLGVERLRELGASPSGGRGWRADCFRTRMEEFDAAYRKACESSQPQDWMDAALLAQQFRKLAYAVLTGEAPKQEPPASTGWVLVPRELTDAMLQDGGSMLPPTHRLTDCYDYFREAWAVALEARPAAPSHPGEADRVGLGELAARFEAKRIEAAGFADEQASCYDSPTGPIEAQYRTEARTWAEARDMARAGAAGSTPSVKADITSVLQDDLAELLTILGMGDHARPQSPHEVFQDAIAVLRKRLNETDRAPALDQGGGRGAAPPPTAQQGSSSPVNQGDTADASVDPRILAMARAMADGRARAWEDMKYGVCVPPQHSRSYWVMLAQDAAAAIASPPLTAERVDLGGLERLSAAATPGLCTIWPNTPLLLRDDTPNAWALTGTYTREFGQATANAEFLKALWNAYRAGHLVPASLAALGTGEGSGGASPAGSGWSAEPEPVPVSALPGDHPSRTVREHIGSPHYVEGVRGKLLDAIGKACAAHDIHIDGKGRMSMEWEQWGRVKPAIDAVLELYMGRAIDVCLERVSDERAKREDAKRLSPKGASAAPQGATPQPLPHPQAPNTLSEVEEAPSGGRDFELMLARIIHRHGKGLDLSETVAGARDLLARKGSLSPLREASPLPHPQAPNTLSEVEEALIYCAQAIDFFDRVKSASPDEQAAVGADHWAWLESACRKAATLRASQEQAGEVRDV